MELTLDETLKEYFEGDMHGQTQETVGLYDAILTILKAQPKHPDANHHMGMLAVDVGKVQEALLFFKTALDADSSIGQFWLSYIDALMSLDQLADAKAVFDQAKDKGAKGEAFDQLEQQLAEQALTDLQSLAEGYSSMGNTLMDKGDAEAAIDSYKKALKIKPDYAEAYFMMAIALQGKGDQEAAIDSYKQVLNILPGNYQAYNNIGNILWGEGEFDAAIDSYKKVLKIKPDYAEAHYNMGIVLNKKGNSEAAIGSYKEAIKIKPNHAEAYNNMGTALNEVGDLEAAMNSYKQALKIKPDFANVALNLSGLAGTISSSKSWIEHCLQLDENHLEAKLILSALRFYEGDKSDFNNLMHSSLKDHPYMRSIAWVFDLPQLPELYFHRWALFDNVIGRSKEDRPFYEFGVWRGEAFRYLIKTFKKGYGFDTFEGIPEDWDGEKAGTYSSDGQIPQIEGGEFIVGKFDDTLPTFFSEPRPMASVINFDADLYSSTICALNYSKPVIDQHTILIFDEFIMNENWEQDEYKAINEYCLQNSYAYEVLAISFMTKQVAVKLVGI